MDPREDADITFLLAAAGRGNQAALDHLFSRVYEELRRLASRQLQASPQQHTLATTALVHEAYLKLSSDARWSTHDRSHFFALAARAMRHILIDHARRRSRQKRGGAGTPLSLDVARIVADIPVLDRAEELLALDEALEQLAAVDPELARLVEWRFFAGLSVEEIARTLEISERTVKRQWRTARAFLYQQLAAPEPGA